MGKYADYLAGLGNFDEIQLERKKTLSKISELRGGRDMLVLASDLSSPNPLTGIDYTDLLAVQDQLENLSGEAIDIILETPGGIGEIVEDIVRHVRGRYNTVGMIIPGHAKSAGTILAMAGDEILMGEGSSLGPIDGQLVMGNGKSFSADAFLEGFRKIKREVEAAKRLNPAYIPILQNISPGEIQKCENFQNFSKHLVTDWLAKYMFKGWDTHPGGSAVTDDDRRNRAEKIAKDLGSQSKWFTHARSIKMADLEGLGVRITNYTKDDALNEAITSYYTLLRMSFESTPIYKIFETGESHIYRYVAPVKFPPSSSPSPSLSPSSATVEVACTRCKHRFKVQINLKEGMRLEEGAMPYPISTDSVSCPECSQSIDVTQMRRHVEMQTGRRAVE